MKSLIKKDLLLIKGNFKFLTILFAVYAFMAFNGQMDLSFILPFLSVVLMMSTFSYDTYNKWDAYSITLPGGRENSVKAKYMATILLIILASFTIFIISMAIAYIKLGTIDFENILSIFLGSLFSTVLVQSFMYPAIYKFGIEKARIGIFVIVFGTSILLGIISRFVDFSYLFNFLEKLNKYWIFIFPIVIVGMLYVSYKISKKIYDHREF